MYARLAGRMEIWKRRAHIDRPVQVRLGDTPVPWITGPRAPCIVLPQDAGRWPVAVQDAVLMHELSHVDRNNLRWFLFGRVVAALYWPIPGVARLCFRLSAAYQQTSDVFAMRYIRDTLSYARGMRHVRGRMDTQSLAHHSVGTARLAWGDIDSLAVREKHIKEEEYCDPFYDRVFWAVIQATLAMFLLTGMTLEIFVEEDPPPVMLFEQWEFSFQRIERDEGLKVIKRYSRNSRRTESPSGDK